MKNEKLRADIKRELNRPTSMRKLAELLNRCYAALGELDTSMLPAEARAGLAIQRNEIDRLKQQLRTEGDRIAELNAKLGEQQSVAEDAARYQWLVKHSTYGIDYRQRPELTLSIYAPDHRDGLSAAIDAAMGQGGSDGQ